ncbi:hypothetical protein DAEQUDRAFT_138610 [Daedalea quercina L-15889]|uniref:Uncharacterized protein n=1 Tax=Daedalea quercina L-15889 TaxID=1314783 RepID=A0A165RTD5_9APHY|nr:hypothetical protein DAEQUDRAFT_138610 [Daedalea quercina L-15889]
MYNSSWAPNETSYQIFTEETWLQGALLSNIAYGVELTLFVMCFHLLARQTDRHNKTRQICLLSFITVIFVFGTLFVGGSMKFAQQAFVEYRNYPGGPAAFEEAEFSDPVDEIANVSWVVSNWLMDTFLVWRFVIIYKNVAKQWTWLLLALPCLMLLASVGLGITTLIGITGSSPFAIVNITLAILMFRHRMRKLMGVQHTSTYANVIAILVESAALYSIFAILFIVPFGLGNPVGNIFLQVVNQVQTVTSLLIIFRVATGTAWSENTATKLSTGSFSQSIRLPPISDIAFRTNQSSTAAGSFQSKELQIPGVVISQEVLRDDGVYRRGV